MRNSALTSRKTTACLPLSDIEASAQAWLTDGEIRQHSLATRALREIIISKLVWFLRQKKYAACGTTELKQFFLYLTRDHKQDGGRWGDERRTAAVRPTTVQTYHRHLRTFFRYLVAEEVLEASPMEAVPVPSARADQIKPFTREQVTAILETARRSKQRRRDEALVLFLLDTGLRASELCSLRLENLDLQDRRCTVTGKGNKRRTLPFGGAVTKALWQYLREDPRDPSDPVFLSERGEAFTRWGVRQVLERLGDAAGVKAVRCSPHTLRHTFAVEFLRAGGNVFTLQQLLGHTSLTMTNRYVAFAQADIEAQHRQFSPADRIKGRPGRRKN